MPAIPSAVTRLGFAVLLLLVAAFGTPPAVAGDPPPAPTNGGFELARPGASPDDPDRIIGWFVPAPMTEAGLVVERTPAATRSGEAGLRIDGSDFTPGETAPFGNVIASFDAAPWRGRPFRFEAWLRVQAEEPSDRAQPWIRIDREGGRTGFFENSGTRPVTDTAGGWRRVAIEGTVDPDAVAVTLGIMTFGDAVVDVDDVAVVATGPALAPEALPVPGPPAFASPTGQPGRALDERGRRNLVAFARAAGQVRWFHAAPSVIATDWDAWVAGSVERFEAIASDADLASALGQALGPIAPGVQVWTGPDAPRPARVGRGADAVRTARREHHGFLDPLRPDGTGGPYRSERVLESSDDEWEMRRDRMPVRSWIPAGHATETELVPGVHLRLPIRIDAEVDGTAWRRMPGSAMPDDRALRLAGAMKAWNVLEHFFPYHDVVAADWPAALPRALDRAAVATGEAAYLEVLEHLVDPLDDGHVQVRVGRILPEHALPLRLGIVEDEVVVLASAAADVAVGDVIESIDGRAIDAWREEGVARICGSPQWTDARLGDWLAMRPAGPTSRVVVRRADDSRDEVDLVCTSPGMMPIAPGVSGAIAELEPGIWYVDLGRVVMMDLDAAIRGGLAKADGIVWDMRGYPAGVQPRFLAHCTDVMLHSATWCVAQVRLPGRRQWEWATSRWAIPPAEPRLTRNAVMLIGGGSISYAESVSGIAEMHDVAVLVGSPTAGANGNVTTLEVHGGGALSWTGMKVVKHDGSVHHALGVQPDVEVRPTIAGIRAGRDEVLERGLEVLRGRR